MQRPLPLARGRQERPFQHLAGSGIHKVALPAD